jgi:hypothetical protein
MTAKLKDAFKEDQKPTTKLKPGCPAFFLNCDRENNEGRANVEREVEKQLNICYNSSGSH